ncbi:hypothetical protein THIOKS12630014 [Thiocapsa sp. KS1]|nr:hypothetical protein THIOKS12630014 [Thiocapsa sp. KS1]
MGTGIRCPGLPLATASSVRLWIARPRPPVVIGGGGRRQPHPGTRFNRCGCSLPGLTGFTVSRCEGTGASHHDIDPKAMARIDAQD